MAGRAAIGPDARRMYGKRALRERINGTKILTRIALINKTVLKAVRSGQLLEDSALSHYKLVLDNQLRLLNKILPDLKHLDQEITVRELPSRDEIEQNLVSMGLDPQLIWQSLQRHSGPTN